MADTPMWTYEVKYFINTGTSSSKVWTFVDYDSTFDPSRDNETYEASYKARKTQPKWVTSSTFTIDFEIDIVDGEDLQTYFVNNEDNLNVETELLRVWPVAVSSGSYPAKFATFSMNMDPLDGGAGEPVKAKGTLDMIDDGWTVGIVTYNGSGVPSFTKS